MHILNCCSSHGNICMVEDLKGRWSVMRALVIHKAATPRKQVDKPNSDSYSYCVVLPDVLSGNTENI
ncbi:uncharacterized protein Dvir_GJ26772, isoform B [Drosophila virilis]|uniref:Uncharacterized protein, isoform B n=1 Tax=Drosophila virilis TaxID=7244 RepID=A0A0Q9WQH0_DROVI|nr:uncharacterized protein Dvir_GJ26772, isoform B [Drosophila virilis]